MNRLITKSLEEKTMKFLLSFPDSLMTNADKKFVDWVKDYTKKYSQLPTVERMIDNFNSMFIPINSDDPIGDIYEQTLTKKRNVYTRMFLSNMVDELKDGNDPLKYIEKLHSDLIGGSNDIMDYSTFDRSEYYRLNRTYPFEINLLDKVTGGVVIGDLCYIIGRLESGKSTFLLWLVKNWISNGVNILFISNEMRVIDVFGKIDSMFARYNPLKHRTKEWDDKDKYKIKAISYVLSNDKNIGKLTIPEKPVKTTMEIVELIKTHKPDIVCIDGVYLMSDSNNKIPAWERIGEVSKELKRIAVAENVAIVGVSQSNRESAGKNVKVENASFSDSIGQDADIVIGLNKDTDGQTFLELIKSRFGKHIGLFYSIDFETMDFVFNI